MTAPRQSAALFQMHREHAGAGEAEQAWAAQREDLVSRGVLDATRDALLIAHVASLARRLDNPLERAYGLAQVSRELRDVYADLEARAARAAATGPDPLESLALDDE